MVFWLKLYVLKVVICWLKLLKLNYLAIEDAQKKEYLLLSLKSFSM